LAYAVLAVRGFLPLPDLDSEHRPTFLFGLTAHDNCPRAGLCSDGKLSKNFGDPNCMGSLGCKGPISHCDVPKRGFVEGVGGCPSMGSVCIACTEPAFPDAPTSPFMKKASIWFFLGEKFRGIGGGFEALISRIHDTFLGRDL
jgi:hydrogenase small subunit